MVQLSRMVCEIGGDLVGVEEAVKVIAKYADATPDEVLEAIEPLRMRTLDRRIAGSPSCETSLQRPRISEQ